MVYLPAFSFGLSTSSTVWQISYCGSIHRDKLQQVLVSVCWLPWMEGGAHPSVKCRRGRHKGVVALQVLSWLQQDCFLSRHWHLPLWYGLPHRLSELDIYVQLQRSHVSKATNRFVHLSTLQESLINDPHLPNDILLPSGVVEQVQQAQWHRTNVLTEIASPTLCLKVRSSHIICTDPCPTIFVYGLCGDCTFLNTFYQHANFINDKNLLGTLADSMITMVC